MKKMTIPEASEFYNISKEAIYNRIRRGSLQSVVEDGVKMVFIDENVKTSTVSRANIPKTNPIQNDRYYKFLEEQNKKLQDRVDLLEGETRSLRDQKEKMLVEERIKIEEIYKEKDEQLKNVLNTLSSQFMLNTPIAVQETQEPLEVEIEEVKEIKNIKESKPTSLKKYLKNSNYSLKKQEKINKKIEKIAKKDERIITVGKKYYIDLIKFDYSDIL